MLCSRSQVSGLFGKSRDGLTYSGDWRLMIASPQTVRIALSLSLAVALAVETASRAAGQQPSSRQGFAASAGNTIRQGVSSRNTYPSGTAGQATSPSVNLFYNDLPSTADSRSAAGEFNIGRDGKPLTPELTELGAKIRECLATYEPKHLNAK